MAPTLPFRTRVIEERPNFSDLLPASQRIGDNIFIPRLEPAFLAKELYVDKLNNVQDWLWVCGRPMPPRHLHHQVLMSREIAITELPELHLVWSKNRIFLKPIPLYLLDPDFWMAHIIHDLKLADCARGFLFSYTALIAYESDFRLAKTSGLLPKEVTWEDWKNLSTEILQNHEYASVNQRYWYGELRLSRLNKIYRLRKGAMRGYSSVSSYAFYADLISDNFATLATILGYVVIVLTAMQVGLGVERLQEDESFQNVSYGFTVFSIIAPLAAGIGILFVVLIMFLNNYIATRNYERDRFREIGVEPFWRRDSAKHATPSSVKRELANPNQRDV